MRLFTLLTFVSTAFAANYHYQNAQFNISTGMQAIFQAAQNKQAITINGKTHFLFNAACRKDIYDAQRHRYITACSAMVLNHDLQHGGRQIGVIGFCNPQAKTSGEQHNEQVMYMPNGGTQNCLTLANHNLPIGNAFSCPCHLPNS